MLSALLTLVVSGVCLQSCSSEYDEYTTEEYGYYTEEEINFINDLAREFKVNIKANPEYYGIKPSLNEIRSDIKEYAAFLGKYKLVPATDDSTRYLVKKMVPDFSRTKTRAEGKIPVTGNWYCIDQASVLNYVINIDISWNLLGVSDSQRASGSATVDYYNGYYNESGVGSGGLSCIFSGSESCSILFGGQINSHSSFKYKFCFEVVHGQLDLVTNIGSFDIISY